VRVNNAAYRRFGIAHVASDAGELGELLTRLLAGAARPVPPDYAALPAAADAVLELAGGSSR
jgi:hypothetical protein